MSELTLQDIIERRNKVLQQESNENEVSRVGGTTRAVAQGISFGFGDEIEALFMSQIKGTSYKKEVEKIRNDIEGFRKSNPLLAYGGEIGGGVLSAIGGGLAVRGLTAGAKAAGAASKAAPTLLSSAGRSAAVGAGQGALYGAGTGEGVEGRLTGAAIGGAAGGVLSGASTLILPKATQSAMNLIKKGIPVTPGASVAGKGGSILGQLTGGMETASTSIPGAGAFISEAKTRALAEFNKKAMLEAIEPITGSSAKKGAIKTVTNFFKNKTDPAGKIRKEIKGLYGNEAYDAVANLVSKEYTKVLSKMQLKGSGLEALESRILEAVKNAGLTDDAYNVVVKRITKNITNQIKTNKDGVRFLSGDTLKKIETDLFSDMQRFQRSAGVESYIGDAFSDVRNVFKTTITEFNPNNTLGKVNLAFAQLRPIDHAVKSAFKNEGIFSTAQFLQGIKQVDRSFNRSATARGKNLMLNLAREGEDVLGNFTPDSGTASRLLGSMGATGGLDMKQLINPAFYAGLGYAPGMMQAIRGGLSLPGQVTRSVSPFVAGTQAPGLITNNNN
tara:strand:+ start:728 stop:2401 length:1674 start_codon:yes stop_codon:yes gene_type:complete